MAFTLLAIHPIARQAVANPRPLHVGGGLVLHPVTAFRRAEVPDRVHVFVLDESLGQVVAVACDDVDHAARHVGRIQHLIKIRRAQRESLAGDHHHRVAARNRGRHQRDKSQQRIFVGAGDSDHAHRLIHRHRDSAQGGLLDVPAVFIRPRRVREQTLHRRVHFGLRRFLRAPRHLYDSLDELGVARVQILGDEIQDLRTVVSVPHRPTLLGFDHRVRGFHRVADVLAVAVADLPDQFAFRSDHAEGVRAVGTDLLAADVYLRGAVNGGQAMSICPTRLGSRGTRGDVLAPGFFLRWKIGRRVQPKRRQVGLGTIHPFRSDVLEQSLAPALAPEA